MLLSEEPYMPESLEVSKTEVFVAEPNMSESTAVPKISEALAFDMLVKSIPISKNLMMPSFDTFSESNAVSKNSEVSAFDMLHEELDVFDLIGIIKYPKVHEVDMSGFECL